MRLPRIFNRNRSRDHPEIEKPTTGTSLQMVNLWNEHFVAWNGKLYQSDLVMSAVRPKAKAIGKLVAKHLRDDPKNGLQINPTVSIKMLLRYPNPLMTAQQFQEKMAYQLCLNNNAFALVYRDENNKPCALYPIPAQTVEGIWLSPEVLALRFTYRNGKQGTFLYDDIIHLRQDFCDNDIFGSSPAPALAQLMECVGTIDQGIVKAIRNSGIIRWLLKFNNSMRPEDIQRNVKDFVDNYLSIESETFGAAGVDAKADAKQIEPKDYVPNASITDKLTERVYSFFNTNRKIIQSEYTEDEWNAYYEAEVEPVAIQFGEVLTLGLFSRKEIGYGNRITFEASNLQCASMKTKLNLVAFLDRGIMSANEIRAILNLPPIPGGDVYVRRLDTVPIEEGGEENGETSD